MLMKLAVIMIVVRKWLLSIINDSDNNNTLMIFGGKKACKVYEWLNISSKWVCHNFNLFKEKHEDKHGNFTTPGRGSGKYIPCCGCFLVVLISLLRGTYVE